MTNTESPGSSANSFKHGLFASDQLLISRLNPDERPVFEQLRSAVREFYNPQTIFENLLADMIATQYFRVFKLDQLEITASEKSANSPLAKNSILHHLDRFSRYDYRVSQQLKTLHNRLRSLISCREIFGIKPPHFPE
ncbi:hypothetical protein IT157_06395 [bacterium]|nr:hypothetical protein [bacterium]